MYQLCAQALGWLAEGRPVWLARVVETVGFSSRDRAAAVAYSPGQPLAGACSPVRPIGNCLRCLTESAERRAVWLTVSEADAARAGLSCGGRARLLIQRWDAALWQELLGGDPVAWSPNWPAGTTIGPTWVVPGQRPAERQRDGLAELGRLVRQGVSQTVLLREPDQVVSALWPQVRLHVVGDGQIADALAANAALLGWQLQVVDGAAGRAGPGGPGGGAQPRPGVSGRALQAALAAGVGYIGALGSRHTQAARAGWLTEHGVVSRPGQPDPRAGRAADRLSHAGRDCPVDPCRNRAGPVRG